MRIDLNPIGKIHSPFTKSKGTPVQPRFAKDVQATAVLDEEYAEGLEQLEGFERIWILTWLDRTAAHNLRVIPYMSDHECGIFATRSPSRPNPIGMSCVRLLKIEGSTLHLAEVDLLDGTPILDIKPYAPMIDSYPEAKSGWLDALKPLRTTADDRFEA